MHEISRDLIIEAAGKLQDIGAADEAREILHLLAKFDTVTHRPTWLDRDNLEGLVRTMYPPNPNWSEEMKNRHFHHICIALQLDPKALNEDVQEILRRVENAKLPSSGNS